MRQLTIVRHGESAGNVARDRALSLGARTIDIAERDCDVTLSELGERQARALGRWLASKGDAPDELFCSPYVRAQQTAEGLLSAARWSHVPVTVDERLRDKEFGMLDRLTRAGIEQRYPDQAEMRKRLGKFYYRPPGGESWVDVILRLRSLYETLLHERRDARLLIVGHQLTVLGFRYIIEALGEAALLAIDAAGDVPNCAVTRFERSSERGQRSPELQLVAYNEVAPLEEAGQPVTREADVPAGPR